MSISLLVADDEDTIRQGVAKYIKLHTEKITNVYEAENGEKAIDLIIKHQPDVILLDIQMPLMSGIDVMKGIDKAGLDPVIIILSGYDEFNYAQQALKYGAKEYLLKPVRADDILQTVLKFAEEREESKRVSEEDVDSSQFYKDTVEYISENYAQKLTLETIAEHLGMSRSYFSKKFNTEIGCSLVDYLNEIRVNKACGYLEQGYFKTYEIAYKVGFADEKYFSRVFKKLKGISPREYKKQTADY